LGDGCQEGRAWLIKVFLFREKRCSIFSSLNPRKFLASLCAGFLSRGKTKLLGSPSWASQSSALQGPGHFLRASANASPGYRVSDTCCTPVRFWEGFQHPREVLEWFSAPPLHEKARRGGPESFVELRSARWLRSGGGGDSAMAAPAGVANNAQGEQARPGGAQQPGVGAVCSFHFISQRSLISGDRRRGSSVRKPPFRGVVHFGRSPPRCSISYTFQNDSFPD